MNKEQIKEQLKLSKKQNKNERYDYLCSQFNCVNYAINLEKYTNKLQKQNKKYKEVIDKLNKYIKVFGKYDGEKCTRGFSMMTADFNKLLDILKEVE